VGVSALLFLLAIQAQVAYFETALTVMLAGILGLGLLALFLGAPAGGVAALVVCGMSVPIGVSRWLGESLNVSILLAALLGLASVFWMIRNKAIAGKGAGSVVVPLLLLAVFSTVSFAIGQFAWYPADPAPLRAQLAGLAIIYLSAGACISGAAFLQDARSLRVVVVAFLIVGSVRAVLSILPASVSGVLPSFVSEYLIPGSPLGSMFWTWLSAHLFAQLLLNRNLRLSARFAVASVLLVTMYSLIFVSRDWASGWLPSLVAVVTISAFVNIRRTLIVVLLLVLLLALEFNSIRDAFYSGDQQYSLSTREAAARITFKMIAPNPLFGLGPANYHHYAQLFSIKGWYVRFSSHNNYLDILAQTGVFGLTCFLWFLCAMGRTAVRLRRRVEGGFDRAYAFAMIGGVAGTACSAALGDWVIPFVYNVGIAGFSSSVLAWCMFGGALALASRSIPQAVEVDRKAASGEPVVNLHAAVRTVEADF
jgi:O-antigen ligase